MTTEYDHLLQQTREDLGNADFAALRMAYTRTDSYNPYESEESLLAALTTASAAGDWQQTLAASNALMGHNYLYIKAHQWARAAYEELGQSQYASFHHHFATG